MGVAPREGKRRERTKTPGMHGNPLCPLRLDSSRAFSAFPAFPAFPLSLEQFGDRGPQSFHCHRLIDYLGDAGRHGAGSRH